MAYMLPGWTEPKLWHRAHPDILIDESDPPEELFEHIAQGGLVEAHNAFFERVVWRNVMTEQHLWPEVPHEAWRCSAAKASAHSLPRDLENACQAVNLPIEKDMDGRKLMLKLTKPRQMLKAEIEQWCEETGWFDDHDRLPGKKNPALPIVYHENPEELERLWEYCKQDVRAEHAFSQVVQDLSNEELRVWLMDQKMNEKGAAFDADLCRAALRAASKWKDRLNAELLEITGIEKGSQRAAVKDWLAVQENVPLEDTAADTIDYYLKHDDLSPRARRVMEIMKSVNRTSTRKFQAVLNYMDTDGRVRDLLMYHGAGTGRWSGKGVQVQNFPRGDLKSLGLTMDEACDLIKEGDVDWMHAMYGDVMTLLSWSTRGTLLASAGRDFMVADYSAIEARCVLWEANAQSALDVFRRGEDIYCDMATGIYGFQVIKGKHFTERQFGKQAILGLGYGMGFLTFLLTCRKYDITFSREDVERIMGVREMQRYEGWVRDYLFPASDAETSKKRQASKVRRRLMEEREDPKAIIHELALMKYTVDVYRGRYPEVKQMWKDQEAAAIAAVQQPGQRFRCGVVTWYVEERTVEAVHGQDVKTCFLYCELPSGRRLAYCSPEIKPTKTSWGETKPALRYMSVNGTTRKWERTHTYGGKLVENITQAIARDVMSNAMVLMDVDDVPYDPVITVHDETVSEVDKDEGSREDYEALMSSIPSWADGCPIEAEAERIERYRKL